MAFKPVVALVGRANVGKSTLFNRITRSRAALVADFSGLTRDRHYGEGRVGDRPFIAVDTGGFEPVAKDGILLEMARQTQQAIAESDVVIFLVDARAGVNAHDHEIATLLRKTGQRVMLAVNKAEGMRYGSATAEFHELGLGEPHPISASHGDGVVDLIELALSYLDEEGAAVAEHDEEDIAFDTSEPTDESAQDDIAAEAAEAAPDHRIKLAIVGRPNVGKSTLINTLLGEERVIAFDMPGTTRDAIEIEFDRGGVGYTLIDTAGLRRRGKVFEAVEKFSVIKTLQAIEASNVVVLMLDAQNEISDQDAHIAGFVLETGRALVVAINKWDGLDGEHRDRILREFERKLRFLSFAKMHTTSALNGQGVNALLKSVIAAHAAAFAKLSTPRLTRVLHAAVEQQQPPRKGIFRPKMRYAHQGGQNPPLIVIHGNALDAIPDSYRRYLETRFRTEFKLDGTPLRIEFKSSHNPYIQGTP
ncbi:ribosome biogenesis GTPase Der [Pollutimonas thiosulfatoxidans]|uniref:GTPase Der n=1 Tax=Pollutimonas thiosulfatoxidans TaxID=2028345 RepID=A0A451FSP2_9BURK|nr:ribosome biogenesis GTPase Der [Pollutimonas thiosulfatoxidans]MBF6617347.1 ribosome biogenesis GTPase Der [Candidimonas sp.]NYT46246.1 ribosome biogenesis GTPase Der [Alcaligenaceae bacterium]QAA95512.1 ribosome biogenesis GTPase Der [Pollutimonas thiosulfatoxidans]